MLTSEYCEIRQIPTRKHGEKSTATYSQTLLGILLLGALCKCSIIWKNKRRCKENPNYQNFYSKSTC